SYRSREGEGRGSNSGDRFAGLAAQTEAPETQSPRGAERAPRGRRSVRRGGKAFRAGRAAGRHRGAVPVPARARPPAPATWAPSRPDGAQRQSPQKGLALVPVPTLCVGSGASGVTSGSGALVVLLPSGSFLPGLASFGALIGSPTGAALGAPITVPAVP